jgi:DNA gyrase subunit A
MVALIDGQPRVLNLKQLLDAFLRHRREVVTRRTLFELRKARNRAHILEGLGIALANIDPMIALIKAAKDPAEAKANLLAKGWQLGLVKDMLERSGSSLSRPEDLESEFGLIKENYHLSPAQAQAILDLRLHRLTGLEQDKILAEYQEQLELIRNLLDILSDPIRLMSVIREELLAIKTEFADARRTEIVSADAEFNREDLIPQEEVVVTISHEGYAKIQSLDMYQAQKRGGKGKAAANVKEEDFIEHLLIANTHDTLLCFSSLGKVYWLKVYQLPEGSRAARGRPIINLLSLAEGEKNSRNFIGERISF